MAVRDALRAVDLAVVLLPAEQDPAYRSVVYEAGAAVGSGAQVVVVGEAATVPPLFEGLHRILPGALQAFEIAVAAAVRKRGTRRAGSRPGVRGESPALIRPPPRLHAPSFCVHAASLSWFHGCSKS